MNGRPLMMTNVLKRIRTGPYKRIATCRRCLAANDMTRLLLSPRLALAPRPIEEARHRADYIIGHCFSFFLFRNN